MKEPTMDLSDEGLARAGDAYLEGIKVIPTVPRQLPLNALLERVRDAARAEERERIKIVLGARSDISPSTHDLIGRLLAPERPERQEQTKHEKKSARSTYCRCGYPWIGDRCASPDVERTESQEKPKEEE